MFLRKNLVYLIASLGLIALLSACNKQKKIDEKIDFYKSQQRDSIFFGKFLVDISFSNTAANYKSYFEFKEDGNYLRYKIDTITGNRIDDAEAYWYTDNNQFYFYIPSNDKKRSSGMAETTGRYEYQATEEVINLYFFTGVGSNLYIKKIN